MEKILFVCLGNICRSPMAEGAFRHVAKEKGINLDLDSCGTGGWHAGEAPDSRMQSTSLAHGVDISDLRARQFEVEDFDKFDRIYVMDTENRDNVLKLARSQSDRQKVKLMLNEIYPNENKSVPDPYFGGQQGFEYVFELLMRSAEKVLSEIEK
ncbi:MAG: low molecular weight phosphotyrosine protein phosphatase [Salibacteraceae bacterium]|jgi:protein-tyrosine phosphatase|nr:low molecular weight phosphotyrosine protein phosphatase [Salibacteraceae bacterium]